MEKKRNMLKQKELFSIRKISVGVASVIIGASMLSGAQPLVKTEVQAKDKIEVEATKDVEIKKLALHQLEKRKELGRWEYERKNK